MRIKNNTDETIVIEPDESIDVFAEDNYRRIMASRMRIIEITERRK